MEKELMDKILSEISKGIEEARKSIKKYGATIPKQDITVIIRNEKGALQAIKRLKFKIYSDD